MEDLDLTALKPPGHIIYYDMAAVDKATNHVKIKNAEMLIGDHKMLIPEATLIINGGK